MNIREMHYDFKKKYNKIDSEKNRNLLVPEIDWTINEAIDLFIQLCIRPDKAKDFNGFEGDLFTTESLQPLVPPTVTIPIINNIITLPSNYYQYARCRVKMIKGKCVAEAPLIVRQHDDLFEESYLYNSSFEWREINAVFNSQGIKIFTDGTFKNVEAYLTYIRKHVLVHNAQDYVGGTYVHPSGITLTGSVNCELPEKTHRRIVDIAVLIASGEIQASDFQAKLGKVNLNKIV